VKHAWAYARGTVRRGDVPHVERPRGAGGSKRFTACGRRAPAYPVKQT